MGIYVVKADRGRRDQLDPTARQQRRGAFINTAYDQHIRILHPFGRERFGV